MSQTITILTGSMRPNSVGDALLPLVREELESRDNVTVQVADVKEMKLPFVDTPVTPMHESFEPVHDSVKAWQKVVAESDALVLLAPEYNYQPSAVQKNAIDWLGAEWKDKPAGIVSYGWGGGQSSAELLVKLLSKVEARPLDTMASLFFTRDISLEGEVLNVDRVRSQIGAVADAVSQAR